MTDGPDQQPSAEQSANPWQERRNLAERLFPGPSNPMSPHDTERVQRLIRSRTGRGATTRADGQIPPAGTRPQSSAPSAVSADDVARLQDSLDAQNELLRAILSSSVDAQTDARSTAQNSRTFAWAGTLIALLTLVATVVLIVNGG